MLDELLAYRESPPEAPFVSELMRRVQRQRRVRRWILAGSGVIGAAFGVAGAVMLFDPVAQAFARGGLPLGAATVLVAAAAFWLLQDEVVPGA